MDDYLVRWRCDGVIRETLCKANNQYDAAMKFTGRVNCDDVLSVKFLPVGEFRR